MHLLENVRVLFFQAKLPFHLWGESVLCAAYIINIMPLSALHNVSPFHNLHDTIPDTSHLRSFGCLCFVSIIKLVDQNLIQEHMLVFFLDTTPSESLQITLSLDFQENNPF